MMVALDHTETVDAASIEVTAADQPVRKRPLSHSLKPSKLFFCHRARS